ncbi:MAG: hypothetical protein ACLSID_12275 [Lactococcus lactis]
MSTKKFKTKKDLVVIDREGLESTVFKLLPDGFGSAIYEFENNERTDRIIGYNYNVNGVEGPYEDVNLTIKFSKKLVKLEPRDFIQFKVDMDETKIFSFKNSFEIKTSIWISEIEKMVKNGVN